MALSPTQRTLRALRDLGRVCAITEKWNRFGGPPRKDNPKKRVGCRVDLFGFIDLIALDPQRGIIGIQSCGQAFAAHRRALLDSPCTEHLIECLRCGGTVELWGWRKVKIRRGAKAMVWRPRVEEITLDMITGGKEESP